MRTKVTQKKRKKVKVFLSTRLSAPFHSSDYTQSLDGKHPVSSRFNKPDCFNCRCTATTASNYMIAEYSENIGLETIQHVGTSADLGRGFTSQCATRAPWALASNLTQKRGVGGTVESETVLRSAGGLPRGFEPYHWHPGLVDDL
ncbi:hypothetical protein PoB_005783700 [Plakobranchus ocellatus]|uniref:Uncharacterized protein n=1 Tax=Plakobranchus ocellatus TaxID=259542 RepID=A0AAV4CI64_9GAST|nr:hypothetical protein PoB_005783700 [Plakobranchus ocellatus]